MSTGVTYVLIVAVEYYNQPKNFPRVKYATKDATEFAEALKNIGVDENDIKPLFDKLATKTAIEKEIDTITKRALKNDRIIFYFSGHGAYENKGNYLLPVDCYNDDIAATSVSINQILGKLNGSLCEKNLLFLDCCHSGFEPGTDTKEIDKKFLADELIYNARDEEYTLGFASCKSNQTSITHPALKNGVWSHFLIKALNGDAGGIYERGILFSDKLQTYLNKTTKEYVKMNTDDKKDQVPIIFGNVTDRFIIADLNPIFEERERLKKVDAISFTNISLLSVEEDNVKNLPGFQKGYHKVPNYIGSSPNSFIQDKGTAIIEKEISTLSEVLKEKLQYRRKEIRPSTDEGGGAIETPDFDYSITISQSENEPGIYIITRKLENFKNSEIVNDSEFNRIFSSHFDNLVFDLSNRINITELIDKIEALDESSPIKVKYNPSDLSKCKIEIKGLDYSINVTTESISITSSFQTTPLQLITAFKETHNAILANQELNMLE